MTLKPYTEAEPVGRREYEREHWGNGLAKWWYDLTADEQAVWEEKARTERAQRADDGSLIGELINAWTEVITINKFARQNGGKAHWRLWAAIDAIAENRGAKP